MLFFIVYVSHANGPLNFFVNFEKNTAEINKTFQYMGEQSKSTMAPLESFDLGKVCAAYFPEDHQFYRAAIL